jgi:hypothetical protein
VKQPGGFATDAARRTRDEDSSVLLHPSLRFVCALARRARAAVKRFSGESAAFSCKGRGFCPSCLGRRMAQTPANLTEHVLPPVPLRQWVLTVPFELRARLGFDGKLLGAVSRLVVDSVLGCEMKSILILAFFNLRQT